MRKFKQALSVISVVTALVICLNMAVLAVDSGMTTDSVTAVPTASAVLVNGTTVSFQAYTISGSNYFKLRDLGKALNGSAKQFEIGYDSGTSAITITTGQPYTTVGGELTSTGDTANKPATLSKSSIYVNGTKVALTAYTIGGYNYFKLRDVAAAVDFGVTYDNVTRNIGIDTAAGYTTDTSPSVNPLVGSWYFDIVVNSLKDTSYIIFSDNGDITQFVGDQVATYKTDDKNMYVTELADGSIDTYSYSVTAAHGQTTLYIKANQLGEMVRDGETTDTSANSIPGLWLSKNSVYANNTSDLYFYFSKSSNILLGIADSGKYTISASGDSFNDNLTTDGSYETTTFKITTVDGITELIATDSKGNQTIMYKE
jgi:hypothetical protein